MPEACCHECGRLCGTGAGADRRFCLLCATLPQLSRLWSLGSHNEFVWAQVQPELLRIVVALQNVIEHSTVLRCLGSEPVEGTSSVPRPSEEGDPEEALSVLEEPVEDPSDLEPPLAGA